MALFIGYLVANLLLAIAAFWVAMTRPQYARHLWWIVAVFVVGAVAYASYLAAHGGI